MAQDRADALPQGYELDGYRIERVLGAGGFGITYLATDLSLNRAVAVKEYLPSGLAHRAERVTVQPLSASGRGDYEWGLARFRDEGQTLTAFRHPNIVAVHRFFQANGTAYLVMAYEEGESLAQRLRRQGALDEHEIWDILDPLLDGLDDIHRNGFLHRDIKPDNIVLREDGSPVLIDFGAARQALTQKSRALTAIVSGGYAPVEQYSSRGHQTAAADIYGVAATLYRAVAGEAPPEATDRVLADQMRPAVEIGRGRYDPRLLEAIDAGLAVRTEDRPQTVAEFRRLLAGRAPTREPAPAPPRRPRPPAGPSGGGGRGLLWGAFAAVLALAAGAGVTVAILDRDTGTDVPATAGGWGPGDAFRDCPDCPEMVVVPPGSFIMGASPDDPDAQPDEIPARRVDIAYAFAVGRLAVTFDQWDTCVRDGGCRNEAVDDGHGRGTRPVINVDFNDAREYVAWLGRATGHDYRLLSEAEWEYAARAGSRTPRYWGAGIDDACRYANVYDRTASDEMGYGWEGAPCRDGHVLPAPGGSFEPNAFGLHDMLGNVWEWVADCWHPDYAGAPTDGSPRLDGPCEARGQRGGNWASAMAYIRVSARNKDVAGYVGDGSGFRVARTLAAEEIDPAAFERTPDQSAAATTDTAPLPGTVFAGCAGCPEMVVVPAGRFVMGSDSESAEEGPAREVRIPAAFAIGRFEVTFDQWQACLDDGGCRGHRPPDEGWGRGARPVIHISWHDAAAYAEWLARKTGRPYRLPSEAEWEYAARGGTDTRYWWGDAVGAGNAVCDGCGSQWDNERTAPVGSFAPNPFGLHDVSGNVFEWVADCYRAGYDVQPVDGSPWGSAGQCGEAVGRGGAWWWTAQDLRMTFRDNQPADYRSSRSGFRVALSLE